MDAPLPLLLLLAPSFLSPATGSSFAREGWEGRGSQPQEGRCVWGAGALRGDGGNWKERGAKERGRG